MAGSFLKRHPHAGHCSAEAAGAARSARPGPSTRAGHDLVVDDVDDALSSDHHAEGRAASRALRARVAAFAATTPSMATLQRPFCLSKASRCNDSLIMRNGMVLK